MSGPEVGEALRRPVGDERVSGDHTAAPQAALADEDFGVRVAADQVGAQAGF